MRYKTTFGSNVPCHRFKQMFHVIIAWMANALSSSHCCIIVIRHLSPRTVYRYSMLILCLSIWALTPSYQASYLVKNPHIGILQGRKYYHKHISRPSLEHCHPCEIYPGQVSDRCESRDLPVLGLYILIRRNPDVNRQVPRPRIW